MLRCLCLFPCSMLFSLALAAPVPKAKPANQKGPWFDGWDKPFNPKGACLFERKGEELAITVAGGEHRLGLTRGAPGAPCLLREADGDFTLQVRVAGPAGAHESCRAGVLLLAGKASARAELHPGEEAWAAAWFKAPHACHGAGRDWGAGKAAYLRLERRGQRLLTAVSADGKEWSRLLEREPPFDLPDKVKVGVFASSTAEGTFKATFDNLKFAQPAKKAR
jgi:hypothetical protein